MIYQDGEVGDVGEIDMVHRHAVGVFDENAVTRIEARERLAAGWQRKRFFQRLPVAIYREVAEGNVAAVLTAQNRAAVEVRGRAQDRVIANDSEIMRAGREPELRRYFDRAGPQMHGTGLRKAECD